jgi:hypothetical protein
MKNVNHWVIWGLMVMIGAMSSFGQGENKKLFIRESDYVISPDEAIRLSREVLSPILDDFIKGGEGPEGLRRRILALVDGVRRGEINYLPSPAYYPDRALQAIAKLETFESKPLVIAFIPELMDVRSRLSATDFKHVVLIMFAHEMIHLEQQREQRKEEDAKNEAITWAKTILEIIRPLEAKGLMTFPKFIQLSSLLKSMNDNYQDARWVKYFRLP